MIEEISPDEQPGPFDAELDRLLSSSRNDPYKVLTITFEFLKRKTAFFEPSRCLEAACKVAEGRQGACS